jgi:hypothetical protein
MDQYDSLPAGSKHRSARLGMAWRYHDQGPTMADMKSPISARIIDEEMNPIPGMDKAILKSPFREDIRSEILESISAICLVIASYCIHMGLKEKNL